MQSTYSHSERKVEPDSDLSRRREVILERSASIARVSCALCRTNRSHSRSTFSCACSNVCFEDPSIYSSALRPFKMEEEMWRQFYEKVKESESKKDRTEHDIR